MLPVLAAGIQTDEGEILMPVNNEKVPPIREHPSRHFSGDG